MRSPGRRSVNAIGPPLEPCGIDWSAMTLTVGASLTAVDCHLPRSGRIVRNVGHREGDHASRAARDIARVLIRHRAQQRLVLSHRCRAGEAQRSGSGTPGGDHATGERRRAEVEDVLAVHVVRADTYLRSAQGAEAAGHDSEAGIHRGGRIVLRVSERAGVGGERRRGCHHVDGDGGLGELRTSGSAAALVVGAQQDAGRAEVVRIGRVLQALERRVEVRGRGGEGDRRCAVPDKPVSPAGVLPRVSLPLSTLTATLNVPAPRSASLTEIALPLDAEKTSGSVGRCRLRSRHAVHGRVVDGGDGDLLAGDVAAQSVVGGERDDDVSPCWARRCRSGSSRSSAAPRKPPPSRCR